MKLSQNLWVNWYILKHGSSGERRLLGPFFAAFLSRISSSEDNEFQG